MSDIRIALMMIVAIVLVAVVASICVKWWESRNDR